MTYPYLPEGRDIKYISIDNKFMAEACKIRNLESTDKNHSTGAVVVKGGKIIGKGANLSKIKNRFLLKVHKNGLCIRKLLKVRSGEKYWLCPGCASSKYHAEYRSVLDAELKGEDTIGADLFLYGHWWCCKSCWDKMISAGINDVYLVDDANDLFKN